MSSAGRHQEALGENNLMCRTYALYQFLSADRQPLLMQLTFFLSGGLSHCSLLVALLEAMLGGPIGRIPRAHASLMSHAWIFEHLGVEESRLALDKHVTMIEDHVKRVYRFQDFGTPLTPEDIEDLAQQHAPIEPIATGEHAITMSSLYLARLCIHFRMIPPKNVPMLQVIEEVNRRNDLVRSRMYMMAVCIFFRFPRTLPTQETTVQQETKAEPEPATQSESITEPVTESDGQPSLVTNATTPESEGQGVPDVEAEAEIKMEP